MQNSHEIESKKPNISWSSISRRLIPPQPPESTRVHRNQVRYNRAGLIYKFRLSKDLASLKQYFVKNAAC
ncbi:hypothetical protein [Gloeocapsopsis sp. IPPAS B-1203]|uniref:hypothetical protein n=1 Tax=Gloeocapsopsis sp. IPPAS B-1203 TaxID=2049454 RepID=UPI00117CD267|nr:hypothetical protein [Gloeocapsopsis sp. IPPAS B-1203]